MKEGQRVLELGGFVGFARDPGVRGDPLLKRQMTPPRFTYGTPLGGSRIAAKRRNQLDPERTLSSDAISSLGHNPRGSRAVNVYLRHRGAASDGRRFSAPALFTSGVIRI
jgi:hypothetical protein